jgi:uncharacterized protein YjbI with pentapeptide repeats
MFMSQSFRGQNLEGHSFKGENLTGSDFTDADIRSANFANATLIGANFIQARAGHQLYWMISLIVSSLFLAILSGGVSAFSSAIVGFFIDLQVAIVSVMTLLVFMIFSFIIIRRGLDSSLGIFAIIAEVVVILVAIIGQTDDIVGAVIVNAAAMAGGIAGPILGAVAVTSTAIIAKKFLPLIVVAIPIAAVPAAIEGLGKEALKPNVVLISGTITLILIGLSLYIAWRSLAGDKKYGLVRTIAVMLTSLGGTNFKGANLVDADFTQANLKNTDFRDANLKRSCWFQVRNIETARLERTYLENFHLSKLVITKDGYEQNFDYLDLRDLNLTNANLQGASLIGSNLSGATLKNANLIGAKLVQAQLYKTDLTGACLTGAYIQNWGISTDTQFDAVTCDYIFMQLPSKVDPDPCRKPDNRNENFREGDFADFIAPIMKTLDLYQAQNVDLRQVAHTFKTLDLFHHQGMDPAAAAIALKQLSDSYPEAGIEVVALEGRGHEKIRLQTVVSGSVNRSELSAEYFSKYQQIKALPYSDIQSLLSGIVEKNERIHNLEKLLENALQQPKFYVETYQNKGEFVMSQSKGNIRIGDVQGSVSGVVAAGENQTLTGVALGTISGTVTNTINQLPDSLDPNSPGIKELLVQLKAAIEAESELPDEDKVEAFEQVNVLAEAGQKLEDSILQKSAKTAMKILKGTIASLPDARKLAEACAKLLPMISSLLLL